MPHFSALLHTAFQKLLAYETVHLQLDKTATSNNISENLCSQKPLASLVCFWTTYAWFKESCSQLVPHQELLTAPVRLCDLPKGSLLICQQPDSMNWVSRKCWTGKTVQCLGDPKQITSFPVSSLVLRTFWLFVLKCLLCRDCASPRASWDAFRASWTHQSLV